MNARAFRRSLLIFAHDTVMAAVSFPLALYVRLGDQIAWWPMQAIQTGTALFTLTALAVFLVMRLDTAVWRYTSIGDLGQIVRAVAVIIAAFLVLQFIVTRLDSLPRSFLVIEAALLSILLILPRVGYRLLKDGTISALFERNARDRVPVLLVGAGDGADLFIRETAPGHEMPYRVVGIVDDRESRNGRRIRGVPVFGGLTDLEAVVQRLTGQGLRPQRIVLTRRQMDGATVRGVLDRADALGIPVSRMPVLSALETPGDAQVQLRPINVEDVLGRPQATLDRPAMQRLIAGRRVLVTGAGGTIGSELVRQIADLGPARITLVDQSEYALYRIDLELAERVPELPRAALIGDVRDPARVTEILSEARPEILFHAAALKHVPLMEANVCDAVLTNAIGTRIVADAARAAAVGTVVVISTDKAVNPTNVMGATKRLAEAYCQALDLDGGTRFVTTRFGNVLGSTGSVVPLFQRQLERGGPLTVTHPDITRYFMTVREAVELVLQAAALENATPRERGGITVLDMGEPVKIVDLADRMIRLAGLEPGKDIQIAFTGLRPGEKLHEELFHGAETLEATEIPAIRRAHPRTADHALIERGLDELEAAARSRQMVATVEILGRMVPEYESGTAKVVAAEGS
ncbi:MULTISPECIES: polysaccharide biosynthesis protein [Thalassobaculum]|uniref:O-antigen biosynthesis protein WbqV n=1 Tax=Thalassobaculum litoreum DSM 18839 TaxID=1123362 RepID=A0A8G2BJQ4_9PROT|nr:MULTISPECIES: nucleoside-diphosphate sugar epimerase/dehydratase [Thalassobaculum]SDG09328.1 O-antigen biosynthesis protein WbqV [Thalassobaculum litoreum DSM 18839]